MRAISSRQNQVVTRYRAAAHGEPGAGLLLDGLHLVGEALAAGLSLRHAIVAVDRVDDAAVRPLLGLAGARGVELATGTAPVMNAVSPVASASPMVAIADVPAIAHDLLAMPDALVVVACDVQDPGNLGAIVRVAEAGGAAGVLAAGQSADPLGWKALRGSMGSALRLPVQRQETAMAAMKAARAHGLRIAATVPRNGVSMYDADLTGALALFIGGEGPGLPAEVMDVADLRLTVPMEAPVESLNAAVTAAVIVYEARRQRIRP